MSDRRPDLGDPEQHDRDLPPMLVLGDDQPDVEDTTAEELARQRAELDARRRRLEEEDRRRRAEAEKEAEELRREAEEKLARERREAEIELARRQREIDDAERRLERNRRRLEKKGVRTTDPTPPKKQRKKMRGKEKGNSLLAAVDRRSGMPVPKLGRAGVLAVAAAALVALGAPMSIDPPPEEAVAEFVAQDEARVGWAETALTLDRDVVGYLGGEDVVVDGEVPSVAQARALSVPDDYYLDSFVEGVAPLLSTPGTSPQRVLSGWTDARESARYTVSTYDVDRAAEELDTDRALPTWMLLGAFVAVGGLAYGLYRGGTRAGAGLAALALVPTGMLIMDGDRHLDVEEPIAQHSAAMDGAAGLDDQLEKDLGVVLGTRSLERYQREDYWVSPDRVDEDEVEPSVVQGYASVRAPLQDVELRSLPLEDALPHAEALIEAGATALAAQHERVEQARAEVVAATESDLDVGPYVATAVAAGLLPLVALIPAFLRRMRVAG